MGTGACYGTRMTPLLSNQERLIIRQQLQLRCLTESQRGSLQRELERDDESRAAEAEKAQRYPRR